MNGNDKKWYKEGIKKAFIQMPVLYWIPILAIFGVSGLKNLVVDIKGIVIPKTVQSQGNKNQNLRLDEIERTTITIINASAETQKSLLKFTELVNKYGEIINILEYRVTRNEKDISKITE